jgi:lipoprotein-anchoring transpeptidase ErfK/SrfK
VPYEITADDLAQIGDAPADWEVAAKLPAMACHSLPELLSEKFHSGQGFLRTLNPAVLDWQTVAVGQRIWVPNVRPVEWKTNLAQVVIDTHEFRLRGYDTTGHLLCSFPCSIARNREKVPTNDLTVVNIAPNPNYTFDPANFPESARAKQIGHKLILPPGPRNPVGVYWISLSQPGYGMHGTPKPETIGNMESHGCFRLCNWDARTLGNMIAIGMPVLLDEPPRVLTPVAVAPAAATP